MVSAGMGMAESEVRAMTFRPYNPWPWFFKFLLFLPVIVPYVLIRDWLGRFVRKTDLSTYCDGEKLLAKPNKVSEQNNFSKVLASRPIQNVSLKLDFCPKCGEYLHDEMGHMCP